MIKLVDWAKENDSDILLQWDYEKNKNVDIGHMGYRSGEKVFWKCPNGHSYMTSIKNRTNGHRCYYCMNRKLLVDFNDLSTRFPEIADEWDYELNKGIPSNYLYCSNMIANWRCKKCGNHWSTKICLRTRNNSGCPICGGYKGAYNRSRNLRVQNGSFADNYPELVSEWDFGLNTISPYEINNSTKKSFYWKCKKYQHSYLATTSTRIAGSGCPYCSGKKVLSGFNDIVSHNHELRDEWDFEKNMIEPESVYYTSGKKYYWNCKYCGEEIFSAPRYHRNVGCAKCKHKMSIKNMHQRTVEKNGGMFSEEYKDLLLDWDYEANQNAGIDINSFAPITSVKVFWKCHICGYSWKQFVKRRKHENIGCPACSKHVVFSGFNDLKTESPELASEWSEKNKISSSDVICGGQKSYIWKCRFCEYEWEATIRNRLMGTGCPKCKLKNSSFPEVAIYYYVKKYFYDTVSRYIGPLNKEIDVYIPSINVGIEFDGYYFHKNKFVEDDQKTRILKENGIKLIRVRETNAKGDKLPPLSEKPYVEYLYVHSKKYKGLDEIIQSILETLSIETDKIKIDTYKDRFEIIGKYRMSIEENSFESMNSEHIRYYDYEANYPIKPSNITKGFNIELNWKCPECGHKWQRTLNAELKSKGCKWCNNRIAKETYNVFALYPELSDDLNNENPLLILPNSHKKYWWKCKKCSGDRFTSIVAWRKTRLCNECATKSSKESRKKKVVEMTLEGTVIKEYDSARQAMEETGISDKMISKVCNGNKKTTGGYFWKFGDGEIKDK